MLFWKLVLTSKYHYIPTTKKAHNFLTARANIEDETVKFMSEVGVHKEGQGAWNQLYKCQRSATELRAKWLESIARYKAAVESNDDASKTLKTMIRNLYKSQMHHKLSYITKGAHSGLNYTKDPKAERYYSPKSYELYQYVNGVFKAHAANLETQVHFHKHHMLKVIPYIAFEVNVVQDNMGYKIRGALIQPIEWRRATNKVEIETILFQHNKRHLEKMATKSSPPSKGYLQQFTANFGVSPLADKLL